MEKGLVRTIQVIVFWVQLYVMIKVGPGLYHWVNSLTDWYAVNLWLNSTLEIKMFIGIPVVLIGCLLFIFVYLGSFLYPQYLLEKLEK